jgi:hypothetical protein
MQYRILEKPTAWALRLLAVASLGAMPVMATAPP